MRTIHSNPSCRPRGGAERGATAALCVLLFLAGGTSVAWAQQIRSEATPAPVRVTAFDNDTDNNTANDLANDSLHQNVPGYGPGPNQILDGTNPYGPVDEIGPFDGLGWTCGGSCPPTWRVRAEDLYFTRTRANDSLSTGFNLNQNFPYQQALRITLDRRYDCTHGWEIVYAGPFNWHQTGTAGAGGTLSAQLTTAPGSGLNLSAFTNANFQYQRDESRLQSAEAMYKCWGWNVIATGWGFRYVNLNDDFRFRSVNILNEAGFLRVNTNNDMLLGQLGWDMMFPLGRWSFDTTWKGAIGASVGNSNFILNNAGITEINAVNQEVNFAALIEGGAFVRYFVTPRLTLRAGYEFWWLYGLGLPTHQFGSRLNLNSGRNFQGTQDLFLYGASAGFEYVF